MGNITTGKYDLCAVPYSRAQKRPERSDSKEQSYMADEEANAMFELLTEQEQLEIIAAIKIVLSNR